MFGFSAADHLFGCPESFMEHNIALGHFFFCVLKGQDLKDLGGNSFMHQLRNILKAESLIVCRITNQGTPLPAQFPEHVQAFCDQRLSDSLFLPFGQHRNRPQTVPAGCIISMGQIWSKSASVASRMFTACSSEEWLRGRKCFHNALQRVSFFFRTQMNFSTRAGSN